ncbi:hypothetical protein GQ457_17G014170 [Hibiscus cannabinus]
MVADLVPNASFVEELDILSIVVTTGLIKRTMDIILLITVMLKILSIIKGITTHLTPDAGILTNYVPYNGFGKIFIANGMIVPISHVGNGSLVSNSRSLVLTNLLNVPNIKKNLLSIFKFTKDNNVSVRILSQFLCCEGSSNSSGDVARTGKIYCSTKNSEMCSNDCCITSVVDDICSPTVGHNDALVGSDKFYNALSSTLPSRVTVYKQAKQLFGLRHKPITLQDALPRSDSSRDNLPRPDPLSLQCILALKELIFKDYAQLDSSRHDNNDLSHRFRLPDLALIMTTSRRLAERKVEKFQKNITKRGAVPETNTKKGNDYPVGPVLLGFFVFVVIGSSLFQIIRTATSGGFA